MDAGPVGVCLFLDSEYQHEHSGALLPGGSQISAPQSLLNAHSALAETFNQRGRNGRLTPMVRAIPATAWACGQPYRLVTQQRVGTCHAAL